MSRIFMRKEMKFNKSLVCAILLVGSICQAEEIQSSDPGNDQPLTAVEPIAVELQRPELTSVITNEVKKPIFVLDSVSDQPTARALPEPVTLIVPDVDLEEEGSSSPAQTSVSVQNDDAITDTPQENSTPSEPSWLELIWEWLSELFDF